MNKLVELVEFVELIEFVELVELVEFIELVELVEINCEKSVKLETSPKVTKSKRSLHWCRSISKHFLCRFYYSISQKVLHYRAGPQEDHYSIWRFYYIIGHVLQYMAFITLPVGTTAPHIDIEGSTLENVD